MTFINDMTKMIATATSAIISKVWAMLGTELAAPAAVPIIESTKTAIQYFLSSVAMILSKKSNRPSF
jgi:Na+-translocating ferredoxin:NAD+ oxidoreductase RnfE subunit